MDQDSLILNLQDICFSYAGGGKVLDNLHFQLRKGQKVGVVGYNGCGKTTFLHVIIGLRKPDSGLVEIFGKPVVNKQDFADIRTRIGFLFQDADDQLFSPTVLEDVAFGPLNQGKSPEEAKGIAMQVLEDLGVPNLAERVTYQLSGGEKRLAALATVLAMKPDILLLDEPTTGLDEDTKRRIVKILQGLDLSYILVTHEYDFLANTTDFSYYMKHGHIEADDGEAIHSHFHVHPLGKHPHQHPH